MKFGGAAVSNATGFKRTARLIKQYKKKDSVVIVVSAMNNVTDELFEVTKLLKKKQLKKSLRIIDRLETHHLNTLTKLGSKQKTIKTRVELIRLFNHLRNYITNLSRKRMTAARVDYLVSFGERASVRLLSEALESAGVSAYPIDASNLMATTHSFGNAVPLKRDKQLYLDEVLLPLLRNGVTPVVTGYIGYSGDGCTTTLGRGGSDLSASYLAYFLKATAVYLWKDVGGFFDKDPKRDKTAKYFPKISYSKAEQLAKNGAKIIYWKAIDPIRDKKIPIYVKSFINPRAKGTIIS